MALSRFVRIDWPLDKSLIDYAVEIYETGELRIIKCSWPAHESQHVYNIFDIDRWECYMTPLSELERILWLV